MGFDYARFAPQKEDFSVVFFFVFRRFSSSLCFISPQKIFYFFEGHPPSLRKIQKNPSLCVHVFLVVGAFGDVLCGWCRSAHNVTYLNQYNATNLCIQVFQFAVNQAAGNLCICCWEIVCNQVVTGIFIYFSNTSHSNTKTRFQTKNKPRCYGWNGVLEGFRGFLMLFFLGLETDLFLIGEREVLVCWIIPE